MVEKTKKVEVDEESKQPLGQQNEIEEENNHVANKLGKDKQ